MNKSLFLISAEMQAIVNDLIESGGELSPEIENSLIIAKNELKGKAVSYAVVIRSMEYENDVIDSEIKRLSGLKKSRTNSIERLKTALTNAMLSFEIEEIKTETTKINFRKSHTLEVLDELKVDKKYKTQTVTTKIDKNLIKKDIKNGEKVSGVELKENLNLQIK